MALSDIIQTINSDFESRSKSIIDAAINEADDLLVNFKESEKKENDQRWQAALKHKADAIKKTQTKSDLQSRHKVLAEKRALIDAAFDKAKIQATKLKSDDYLDIITPLISDIDAKSGEIITAKGRLQDTTKALQKARKDFQIKEGDFDGGFIFQSPQIEINATFDRLFSDLRSKLETDIANLLFS